MLGFERSRSVLDFRIKNTLLNGLYSELDAEQSERLRRVNKYWDFYEGYHWEEMPEQTGAEVTVNYCRAFVDKFVSFELGKGFNVNVLPELAELDLGNGYTLQKYLDKVWKDNDKYTFCSEFGQSKSVTGEGWIQVSYVPPEDMDENEDPFGEFPEGKIKISVTPTGVIYPEYDPHNRGVLVRLTIMYMYDEIYNVGITGRLSKERALFRQVWTKDKVLTYYGKKEPVIVDNTYGFIPFVQVNNLPVSCSNYGRSDLEDIIPLNVEYNLKESNVSEIIDYHSAPTTILFGAKVGSLERGANKVWGGLSKDARVENLELRGDLGSSTNYISSLKRSMCEVAGIPETCLGGAQSVSNTSGVALQYINLPLIEKTRTKRNLTETGIERVNKMILSIGLKENIISKPEDVPLAKFLWNEVTLPDTLPKDTLLELQQIEQELKLGLESRRGSMKRLGKENIEELLLEIEQDRKDGYNAGELDKKLNSGMVNGQTQIETLRTESRGANKSSDADLSV